MTVVAVGARATDAATALAIAAATLLASGACGGGSHGPAAAHRGAPLTPSQARALVEDDEHRLADAYAAGDSSGLAQFLAGPELRGNSATINVLNGRHQRNVFHLVVDSVVEDSATGDRTVVTLTDHTTDNAFVDATTGKALNGGLPGPEAQSFVLFLDRNPHDGRWYWTGAQKQPQ